MGEADDGQKTTLDVRQLTFPTDSVQVGNLIKQFPEEFDWFSNNEEGRFFRGFNDLRSKVIECLRLAMDCERELAKLAFELACDRSDHRNKESDPLLRPDESDQRRSEVIAALADTYQQLGIASGEAQFAELARRIESQAALLAERPRTR